MKILQKSHRVDIVIDCDAFEDLLKHSFMMNMNSTMKWEKNDDLYK